MEIIRKWRCSDPKAPVQIVDDITIAASPRPIQLEDALMQLQVMCRKLKLKNSQHRGKPFRCGEHDCSGFAPTDTKLGDWICRFHGAGLDSSFDC
jgi:hypothetical protein